MLNIMDPKSKQNVLLGVQLSDIEKSK